MPFIKSPLFHTRMRRVVVVVVAMVVVLGWEKVVLERSEGKVEPISGSQVVDVEGIGSYDLAGR